MKQIISLLALVLLVSTATAVVGAPEPDEDEMAITSTGSSASSSTSVGPNGTEWTSSVEMRGRNPNVTDGDTVQNISNSSNKTTFSGSIQAPTPCHVIDQETEEIGDQTYRLVIETEDQNAENQSQVCTEQVVMIEYDAEFEARSPYSLEVKHNNETIETISNSVGEKTVEEPDRNLFNGLFQWLGNLF